MTVPADTDKIFFKQLKSFLCPGDIKQLAKENNLTPDNAYKRLAGTVKDPVFVQKACELAIKRANEFLKMKEAINELTDKIKAA